jgi:hypothetical protein
VAPVPWREALQAIAETGDLKSLGLVRYVFAKRTGENTHLTLLWSDQPLSLSALTGGVESNSDVPGADPTHIARPREARRAFSASMPETPYSYNVYVSAREPAALFAAFDEQMKRDGWHTMVGATPEEPYQRIYVKPLLMVMALAGQTEQGTLVSLLETSRRDTPDLRNLAPAARIVD